MATSANPNDTENDDGLEWVDLPMKAPPEVAMEIMAELRDGDSVSVEFDAEHAPDLADTIEWQLENGQRATEYVEEYDV